MKNYKKSELSIILVNWNCGQVIIDCIESIIKTVHKTSYEIIVVDNNSKDGSIEKIVENYPQIKIIKNNYNNMFAGANNQGYAISEGKYIFILNADTVVTENSVDKMVSILKETNESAITCTLLNKDGTIQRNMHRGFPTFIRLFTGLAYKRWGIFGFLPSVKNYLLINNKFDKDFYVEQAAGAAILLKRELIEKLGYLFDEKNFPLFYNDVDLCYRINKLGVKILCKTDIKIYHIGRFSVKKVNFYDHWKTYLISAAKYFKNNKLTVDYLLIVLTSKLVFICFYLYSNCISFFKRVDQGKLLGS